MAYKHLSHCLHRYVPTQVFPEYDLLGQFLSWVPSPQRISLLLPTLVLDALHVLREHRMPNDYPILALFLAKWGQECCVYLFPLIGEGMPKFPLKRNLPNLLCSWELVRTPSWLGTCPFINNVFSVGPSAAWSPSFLRCHELFVWTSPWHGTGHRSLSLLVCHVIAAFVESGLLDIYQVLFVV